MNECGKELYNVITPNGDGANDEFQPIPNNDQPDDYLLVIFNRWGQVVFRSKNHKEAWKGDGQLGSRLVRQFVLFRPEGHVLQWIQGREIWAHQIGEVSFSFNLPIIYSLPLKSV